MTSEKSRADQAEGAGDDAEDRATETEASVAELLLAFDPEIQAVRAQLATDLMAFVCEMAAATPDVAVTADGAINEYLAGSPEAAASLTNFNIEDLVDVAALQAESERCRAAAELTAPKGSGFFTVGVEIAPGKWQSTGTGSGCYWARLDANQDILGNHFGDAGGTVTIRSSDYEVQFTDCGTWEFVG